MLRSTKMQIEKSKFTFSRELMAYAYPMLRPDVKTPVSDLKPYVVFKEGVMQTPTGKEIARAPVPLPSKEVKYKVRVNGRDLIGATVTIHEKLIVITSGGAQQPVKPVAKSHKKKVKK